MPASFLGIAFHNIDDRFRDCNRVGSGKGVLKSFF